jgi:CxxC-x17-CxxC domain-containing protein
MELCYQISGGGSYGEYRSAFTAKSFGCKESLYLDHCVFCEHCFGCVGLKHQKYCILNKQYTKEEYEVLLPQIIEGMIARGEWGEFLPAKLSPFPYNHSVAADYYPHTKNEALSQGFTWSDYQAPRAESVAERASIALPSRAQDLTDAFCAVTILCEKSGKPFRLTKAEVEFYRNHNLPPPIFHPDQREQFRIAMRNPRKIWDRSCSECEEKLATTFSPERAEPVLCDSCYQKRIL